MQNVRIIRKDDTNPKGTVYVETKISVLLEEGKLAIWNGAFWEYTPLDEIKVVATWDEE